ncbi:hypothetical protein HDU93_005908, partial [Gonapodya sp. JEL0774]
PRHPRTRRISTPTCGFASTSPSSPPCPPLSMLSGRGSCSSPVLSSPLPSITTSAGSRRSTCAIACPPPGSGTGSLPTSSRRSHGAKASHPSMPLSSASLKSPVFSPALIARDSPTPSCGSSSLSPSVASIASPISASSPPISGGELSTGMTCGSRPITTSSGAVCGVPRLSKTAPESSLIRWSRSLAHSSILPVPICTFAPSPLQSPLCLSPITGLSPPFVRLSPAPVWPRPPASSPGIASEPQGLPSLPPPGCLTVGFRSLGIGNPMRSWCTSGSLIETSWRRRNGLPPWPGVPGA